MFENTWKFCINPIWIGIWVATPIWLGGGVNFDPPYFPQKCSDWAEIFQKVVKRKFFEKQKIKLLAWRHFSSLQNILAKNRQKWIFLKMLQMGWNFYTNSKIRQKTKKSAQKIDMTSLSFWAIFAKKIEVVFFYSRLSEKFRKNWRHFEFFFDFRTTNIFSQILGKN